MAPKYPGSARIDYWKVAHHKASLCGSSSCVEKYLRFRSHSAMVKWDDRRRCHCIHIPFHNLLRQKVWFTEIYNSVDFGFNFYKHLFLSKPLARPLAKEGDNEGLIIQVNFNLEILKVLWNISYYKEERIMYMHILNNNGNNKTSTWSPYQPSIEPAARP